MADLGPSANMDIGQLLEEATSSTFKLHVTRIPVEISRDGLLNIFGKCGNVIDISIPVVRIVILRLLLDGFQVVLYFVRFVKVRLFVYFQNIETTQNLAFFIIFQGRNMTQPYRTGFVTYATQDEAQCAVESVNNRPPFFMIVNHALTNEERASRRIEEHQRLQNGAHFADRLDEFHKTKGKGEAEISKKQQSLTEAAVNHAIPKLSGGIRGLPANHIPR